VGIVEREEKKREVRGEVGSQICSLIKISGMGKAAVVRWVSLGLGWRTTVLIVRYPYEEQGEGWKEQIREVAVLLG
jgi:hypothetical protein